MTPKKPEPHKSIAEEQWAALAKCALETRGKAYAPYSKFRVGAALLTTDGRVFGGANVENSSYGLTICAERTAACSALMAGATGFDAMVVATTGQAWPCGACRQFLFEWGGALQVMAVDETAAPGEIVTLDTLLPRGFRLNDP